MTPLASPEKPKLLYVDDERPNLTAFRILLRDEYHVLTAENAEEAYRLLQENDIPLVVSDQRMPGMTGTELLAKVAADFPDCARMILTGYSDIDAVIDGINRSHIYYYFKKPWNEGEVRLTLANALESVLTKRRLIDSERRFRSAFEHAGVGMAHLATDGTVLRANSRLQNFLCVAEKDLIGTPITSVFPDMEANELAEVARGGALLSAREAAFRAPGGDRWYRRALTLSNGRDGRSAYLILIVDDLTERKRVEAELAATVSEWENTFDSVRDVIWIVDTEQRIVRCNKSSESVFGLSPEQTVSKTCREVVGQCPCSDDSCPLALMRRTLVREHAELKMGDRTFWVSVDPILDASGRYGGAVHIVSDITARRQIEEERDMLKERLRQSQKLEAIGSLAGGIAHDFNNLLTPIIGYSEIIERKISQEEIRKMTQAISRAAISAKQVTGQLLAFGRKQMLEMKPCDLNEVIGSFQEVMRRVIRENIAVSVRLAPGILCVIADRGQLVQILLNLIVNAQDAMATDGELTIETSEAAVSGETARMQPGLLPGRYALLEVTDTGCGMDEETLSHIFEPFFTTKAAGEGTGLGLATVYGIVKQHGGFIYASSTLGKGSVFRTYLPLRRPDVQPDEVVEPRHEASCSAGGNILIVEDNAMVRDMLAVALREAGYTVYAAANPAEALDISRAIDETFLLLTDMVMPGMTGDELFMELSASRPGTAVLYVSGYPKKTGLGETVLDSRNFLQKPFTIATLLERVRELMRAT